VNAAIGFEEDFLGDVGGIVGVVQHALDEAVDGRVVAGYEPIESILGAAAQVGDEFGFIRCPS
jgi:hypothetical protein